MRVCPQCGNRFINDEAFCPNDGVPTTVMAEVTPIVDPYIGTSIDGRYRIDQKIGEGGMGVVYSATHTVLGKKQCLKILRGDMAKDQDLVQRFIQEAQVASSIGHENIVEISDFGRLPDGSVYFVMELLGGEPLTDLIKRGGSVPMQEAVRIVRQIASALGAAHARGIVHRDLKPDNVYLTRRSDGETFVKVLDFGIAKVAGGSSKLTRTGTVFGTPHYMSPEQAAGQSVDQRTDIYALGVIMYEMFTGKVPFDADTFMGILTKHMFEPPVPPSQANPGVARLGALEDITLKALTKKPELRYQTMDELVEDLDRVQSGGSISIGKGGVPTPGGLADALEPPSRTEMRLSRGGPDGAPQSLPKTNTLLYVAIAAVAFLILAVGGVTVVVVMGSGTSSTGTIANAPHGTGGTGGTQVAPPVGGTKIGQTGAVGATGTGTGTHTGTTPIGPVGNPPGAGTVVQPIAAVPETRRVQVTSEPAGAQVLFEGAMLGNTPLNIARPSTGMRQLEVRLPGYRPQRVAIMAEDGPETIPVTLEAEARIARGGGGHGRNPTNPGTTTPPAGGHTGGNTGSTEQPGGSMGTNEVVDPWR